MSERLRRICNITISHINCKRLFKKVGRHSFIIRPLRIIGGNGVRIGDNSSIYHFARIETFNLSNEYDEHILIGNHVDIQQNVHITSGSHIEIGDGTLILPNVLITDIVHPYNDIRVSPLSQKLETHAVKIGTNCQIGMGARILPGVTIGNGCVIGTNAVVTHSIPEYSVAVGIPAKVIKKYDFQTKEWKIV